MTLGKQNGEGRLSSNEAPWTDGADAEHYRSQLEAVCTNATVALFILNEYRHCVYMNPAAEKLTGYGLREVWGRPLHHFVHHTRPDGTSYPIEECPIVQVLQPDGRRQGEEAFVRRDGTFYDVAFTVSPICEAGAVVGTVVEVRDTTREKQAEAVLMSAHEELERRVEQRTSELARANKLLEEQVAKLKEAEAALTASEEQFKAAQRIAHLGNWERDITTRRIHASDEFWRIFFGFVPEESAQVYESVLNLIHPEDLGSVREVIANSHPAGRPFNLEYRIVRPDGVERVINARGEVIPDERGVPVRVRGIAQDITRRKRAEEEVRRQKEILQKIFDHVPAIISFIDKDMRLILVNREWERTRSWSLEEVRGQNLDVLAEGYPDPEYRQEVMKFITAASGEWGDFRTMTRDGRVLDVTWAVVRLSDGTRVSIGKDITERKRAVDDLRRQKEVLQTIFDHIPIMISFWGADGRIKLVNREWERTRGWTLEEIQREEVDVLTQSYPDPACRQWVREIIAAGTGEWVDVKTRSKGGRVVDVSWANLRLSDGTTISIGQDVTDRKRAEDERARLMNRLLTAQEDERRRISRELHDRLGQYLAALMMGLKSLQKAAGLPQAAQDGVTKLQELTSQFSQEVRHLALELRPTVLDDLGLCDALTNYVEGWSKLSQIKIDLYTNGLSARRLPPQIETALYRVIQEALNNVLKHSLARHASVILEYRGGRVVAVVEDDGAGFDAAAALGAPGSERGLGLTGMRERVESVGGALEVESLPGTGTTIVARIPVPPIEC